MPHRKYNLAIVFLLLMYSAMTVSANQPFSGLEGHAEYIMGPSAPTKVVVYEKKSGNKTVFTLSDDELLEESAWQTIRQVLNNTDQPSLRVNIDFAPYSSVMTASGKEKANLIASVMKWVDHTATFKVIVNIESATEARYRKKLALSRSRAIIAHIKGREIIRNELVTPDAKSISDAGILRHRQNNQNVTFINLGQATSAINQARDESQGE